MEADAFDFHSDDGPPSSEEGGGGAPPSTPGRSPPAPSPGGLSANGDGTGTPGAPAGNPAPPPSSTGGGGGGSNGGAAGGPAAGGSSPLRRRTAAARRSRPLWKSGADAVAFAARAKREREEREAREREAAEREWEEAAARERERKAAGERERRKLREEAARQKMGEEKGERRRKRKWSDRQQQQQRREEEEPPECASAATEGSTRAAMPSAAMPSAAATAAMPSTTATAPTATTTRGTTTGRRRRKRGYGSKPWGALGGGALGGALGSGGGAFGSGGGSDGSDDGWAGAASAGEWRLGGGKGLDAPSAGDSAGHSDGDSDGEHSDGERSNDARDNVGGDAGDEEASEEASGASVASPAAKAARGSPRGEGGKREDVEYGTPPSSSSPERPKGRPGGFPERDMHVRPGSAPRSRALPVQQLSTGGEARCAGSPVRKRPPPTNAPRGEPTGATSGARGESGGGASTSSGGPRKSPPKRGGEGEESHSSSQTSPSSASHPSYSSSQSPARSKPSYSAFAKSHRRRKRPHAHSTVVPSPDDLPAVALGRRSDAASVQGLGALRSLVDELSYLCSALLRCRSRGVPGAAGPSGEGEGRAAAGKGREDNAREGREGGGDGGAREATTIRHAPPTAEAACAIAALLSRPDARAAILRSHARSCASAGPGARTAGGAFAAILASVACAPTSGAGATEGGRCREWLARGGRLCRGPSDGKAAPPSRRPPGPPSSDPPLGTADDDAAADALSLLAYFVGLDCTGSDRAAVPSRDGPGHRRTAELARKSALNHDGALRGMARLVARDPVVGAYLDAGRAAEGAAGGEHADEDSRSAAPTFSQSQSAQSDCSASLPDTDGDRGAAPRDPTKRGRRGRRHRTAPGARAQPSSQWTALDFTQESKESAASSSSQRGRPVTNVRDRCADKLAAALSRAKLTGPAKALLLPPMSESAVACDMCRAWMPTAMPVVDAADHAANGRVTASSLALAAADCIVTGRDRFSSEADDPDDDVRADDPGTFLGSDSDGDDDAAAPSTNPIVYANERVRRSGALPHYARSMSETLLALLRASEANCDACLAYLRRRAAALAGVVDGLCCLSPRASAALSVAEWALVPSLVRTIAELSFADDGDGAPSRNCDALATALNTLTSLTHENADACRQMLTAHEWDIALPASSSRGGASAGRITGVDVVFARLYQTASRDGGRTTGAVDDDAIYCLNVLTNVVEAVPLPAKEAMGALVVRGGDSVGAADAKGVSWLARWVVARTSGFRESVMKGSFGTDDDEAQNSAGAVELKAGEEANLVTAGNGFVLLAYLMTDAEDAPSTRAMRDAILAELPPDEDGDSGGVQFMIRTMKAFCNFYHYSVGDLSVAIVAPVVKLIRGLEAIGPST